MMEWGRSLYTDVVLACRRWGRGSLFLLLLISGGGISVRSLRIGRRSSSSSDEKYSELSDSDC